MTTSNEHNNAPAVPQGEPVAWMVYGNYTRQPFGMLSSAEAYMRGLLKSDPDGGYHIRPLRHATPAPAPAITYDQWQQHEYTKVLQDRIKELSEKLAIYTQALAPAQEVGLTDAWLLEQFKHHPNWELSTSNDPECDQNLFWLVHEVKGGRNDREWFLIGEGATPRHAIIAALRAKGQS
mgnify:FL=1